MKVITQNDIRQINQLYLEKGSYAAVSRALGFSPATVKKYVQKDYQPVEEKNIIKFDRPLPEDIDYSIFNGDDWGALCELTETEEREIRELWKELDL